MTDVLPTRLIPSEVPTAAEARASRRGMAAYERGDYVALEDYIDGVDRRPRRARKDRGTLLPKRLRP